MREFITTIVLAHLGMASLVLFIGLSVLAIIWAAVRRLLRGRHG